MRQIAEARERLEHAEGLAELLDASWIAFDLLVAVCERCQDGSHELFPAFAFAAAAAAEGRTLIALAPSLPAGPMAPGSDEAELDQDEAADALSALSEVLHSRLAQASARTDQEADAVACAQAAFQAAHVHKLLALEA